MTQKQIIKEGIFVLSSFILSLLIFSLATHQQSSYISDIYVGTRSAEGNWYDFFPDLNFLAGIIFFFPTLFIVNTIRLFIHKFTLRHLAVFHLFVSFTSLIISLLVAAFISQIALLFSGSITIYPPLSAISEELSNTYHPGHWAYVAYCFCLVQLLILILTIVKISRHGSS
jgi:hypothetical protein